MYHKPQPNTRMAQMSPVTVQFGTVPGSVGGINGLDSAMGMPPEDCFYCHNLVPSEYALRLRKGYTEWNTNPDGKPINTIIPFEGQNSDASGDRLWVVNEDGIWLASQPDIDPVLEVAFGVQTTGEAGFGVWTEFTNDATDRFLQYADGENGLHEYSEDTGLWTVPTLTGPTVGNIAYVYGWKNRLWYIEQASGDAWYLAPDSNSGNATKFTFGSKFKHGGELKALYSWTRDGGDGVDDFLIAISRGGDVLIYQGSDPSQPDFGLVGSFYIGEVPESRRLATAYGSDLFLLSVYGLTSVKELLAGVGLGTGTGPSAKINRFLRNDVVVGKDEFNWQLVTHPADGFLQVITPYSNDRTQDAIQYVQNLLTGGWGMWEGVPVNCAENWNEEYYIGDKNGRLWVYDGVVDGSEFDGPDFWDNTANGVNPPEWVQAPAGTFTCDGTQLNETTYNVDAVLATPGQQYKLSYEVTGWVAGSHKASYGGVSMEFGVGNGIFSAIISALDGVTDIASIIGSDDFQGVISNVQVRVAGSIGQPIAYDILTSFQAPNGDHASYKRCGFIRTIGVLAGTSSLNVQAVYDYAIQTQLEAPPQAPTQGDNVFDQAIWDEDLWDFTAEGASLPLGALGLGRTIAIGMKGTASTRLNIIGWDFTYTGGGFL